MSEPYDLAVLGGGVMGSAAAIRAAEGGMRVTLLERASIGSGASGVNAGTLSLQIKRVKLMPYALRGHEIWQTAGDEVGFRRTGGLTVAFNEREAALLHERMTMKRDAGAPIELITPSRVAEIEPRLNRRVVAASYCAEDGYANSSRTGLYYRALLGTAGVDVREATPVTGIRRDNVFRLSTPAGEVEARRVLIAAGAWTKAAAAMLGVDLPIRVRVNTVSVTERGPPLVSTAVGHATGLLTLKQKENGTVLIGGGWQGRGTPETGRGDVVPQTLRTNLALALFAVPALAGLRVVRSWTGFEPNVPDFYPLAGPLPGVEGAHVLACVRGGYTIGPYIGRLVADGILERAPEMALFDPGRFGTEGG